MNRLEAIEEVEKWRDSVPVVTDDDLCQLYEVYCDKLEAIDNQCEGYTDFEDVPNLLGEESSIDYDDDDIDYNDDDIEI